MSASKSPGGNASPLSGAKSALRSPSTLASSSVGGAVVPSAGDNWDTMALLRTYGIPLGAVALCGAGAVYLAKRMNDLETRVGAIKRDNVRHLTETDVRLIVQQMQRDGLIHVSTPQSLAPAQLHQPITPPPPPIGHPATPTPQVGPTAAELQEYQQYLYYMQNQRQLPTVDPQYLQQQQPDQPLSTAWTPKSRTQ